MELKYLYAFQAIVEEGCFSKAAEKLNDIQSTIILKIKLFCLTIRLGFGVYQP